MRTRYIVPVTLTIVCTLIWLASSGSWAVTFAIDASLPDPIAAADDSQLPKPDPEFKGKIGRTYEESVEWYPEW